LILNGSEAENLIVKERHRWYKCRCEVPLPEINAQYCSYMLDSNAYEENISQLQYLCVRRLPLARSISGHDKLESASSPRRPALII